MDMELNRRATKMFIDDDPSDITLLRPTLTKTPSGAVNKTEVAVIDSLVVKLIYQGGSDDGIMRGADGQVRKYDFVIVAEHDVDIRENDCFFYPKGSAQKWVINGLQPFNGYEVKAGVVQYGSKPVGG